MRKFRALGPQDKDAYILTIAFTFFDKIKPFSWASTFTINGST